MRLQRRLVLLQVALVAVGVAVFAVVSYSLFSHSAYQRVDAELQAAAPALAAGLGANGQATDTSTKDAGRCGTSPASTSASSAPLPGPPPDSGHNLPAGSYAELRAADGTVLDAYGVPGYKGSACSVPKLPAALTAGRSSAGRFSTVGATSGSTSFRVLVRSAASEPGLAGAGPGAVLVAALPLTSTTRTLDELILLDVSVGVVVLVVLSAAGLVIVRRGLRPLERMAGTARAVAAGDLAQRVAPAEDRSEVGQLGLAFNTMMSRIQEAFRARDATEGRLRDFLADASHELRTPLTSIRGYAELYRLGALPSDDLDGLMAKIEDNARQMGQLVEELLVLAHLDQTRPADQHPVDLVHLVAEACSDAAVTAPGRRLRFAGPEPVEVVGDAGHLRRAVTNLLANAIRHTPEGTPIDVNVTADGGAALVRVRDHGPGFPPDGLAHAFDRFWRADKTAGGNGLGLAIVAAVAGEHGGGALVANAPDGGGVVEVRLPMSRPQPATPAAPGHDA